MQLLSGQIKRTFLAGFVSLAALGISSISLAVTVEQVPNPRRANGGWVTDMAGVLSPSTETQLNQMISQLEAKNGSEIAVVTVPDTAPSATPKQFATSLFNYWGIGKMGKNNGVLFLISKGDRRVEIETGSGLARTLPDAEVRQIIQQTILPQFKQGNFDGGTQAGTGVIIVALQKNAPNSTASAAVPIANAGLPESLVRVDERSENSQMSSLLPWLGGLGIGGGIALAFRRSRPIYLAPKGRSRSKARLKERLHCANCKQPMETLNLSAALPYLSKPENVARKIGSVNFEVLQCPNCRHSLSEPAFHIRARENASKRFRTCPTCLELTVKRSERTLADATEYQEGRRLISNTCQCCSYSWEAEEVIPRIYRVTFTTDSSSSSDCGSSDFGGGSSDGGGDGGSW